MSLKDDGTLLLIGAGLAVAAYFYFKDEGCHSYCASNSEDQLAMAYANLTGCESVSSQLTGNVVLPNGQTVPSSAVAVTCMSTGAFSYGGATYYLNGTDGSGNYTTQVTP